MMSYPNLPSAVLIDIYSNAAQTQTTYVIPGPPLYGSASTTPPPPPPPPTSVPPPTQTGTVAQYGQCGGSGWTGATACVLPYKCTALNRESSERRVHPMLTTRFQLTTPSACKTSAREGTQRKTNVRKSWLGKKVPAFVRQSHNDAVSPSYNLTVALPSGFLSCCSWRLWRTMPANEQREDLARAIYRPIRDDGQFLIAVGLQKPVASQVRVQAGRDA